MVAGTGALATVPPLAVGGTDNMTGTAGLPANPQGTEGTGEVGPTRTNRTGENRRSNKPIMEKRRRARINNCLNELKTLILDAMKKDPARHSKLEKADILEMTVKHLETLQRQQVAMAAATDPAVANKFRAGFSECAGEVGRFPGLEGPVKKRLLQHLANCLNNSSSSQQQAPSQDTQPTAQPVQVTILRTPDSNIIQGLQLVPTRLPNGDIALILPAARTAPVPSPASPSPSNSSASSASPLPMLIPIPNRSVSESPSPGAFDRLSVNSNPTSTQQTTAPSSTVRYLPHTMSSLSPVHEEVNDNHPRLVIEEDYDTDDRKYVEYQDDRETLLHIPERPYYDDSFDDSESEYYQQQDSRPYSPEMQAPLALVTRKRYEENDNREPWRPW